MDRKLDPMIKEKMLKKSVRLDSLSAKELPKELLTSVSGGVEFEYYGQCPRCGGCLYLFTGDDGAWAVFCRDCGTYIFTSPDF